MSRPEIEQALKLLMSDIPSYYLPGLNVKIPEKPLNSQMLEMDSGPVHGEFKQTLTYMLKSTDTDSLT